MAETKKQETKKQEIDPAFELVELFLPNYRGASKEEYVSVNNQYWIIKRGEKVMVPRCVAAQFEHEQKMLDEALAYEESVSQES